MFLSNQRQIIPCSFFENESTHAIALIYVDDILLMGNNNDKIEEVKAYLQT